MAAAFTKIINIIRRKIDNGIFLPDDERCKHLCGQSGRRCLRPHKHGGRCAYQLRGELSVKQGRELMKHFSPKELKSIAGMDVVSVRDGQRNFAKLIGSLIPKLYAMFRKYPDANYNPTNEEDVDRVNMDEMANKDTVKGAETYFKSPYAQDLSREHHDCAAFCLPYLLAHGDVEAHPSAPDVPPNEQFCSQAHPADLPAPFTDMKGLFAQLTSMGEEIKQRIQHCHARDEESEEARARRSRVDVQEVEELVHAIKTAQRSFRNFVGHLARKVNEDMARSEQYAKLGELSSDDGEFTGRAIIVADWKMKLLFLAFREAQDEFYAKRGVSFYGCLVLSPISDAVDVNTLKAGRMYDGDIMMEYYYFLSDDKKQGEEIMHTNMKLEQAHHRTPQMGTPPAVHNKRYFGIWPGRVSRRWKCGLMVPSATVARTSCTCYCTPRQQLASL